MRLTNSLALKEWAVIVHALGIGKQTLLLRKGGLHERHGRFTVEPREFFLFPTYVHQMEQGTSGEAQEDLRAVTRAQPPADQLHILHYALVQDVCRLDSLDRAAALAGLHSWTPETIAQRFAYRTPGLYLFVLRVYQLPHTYVLPRLRRYAGCRSWVELAEALSTSCATPVLSDAAFAEQVNTIRKRLTPPPEA